MSKSFVDVQRERIQSAEQEKRIRDFRTLATAFSDALRRTRDTKILKRKIHTVLPIQAGKLLCTCLDRQLIKAFAISSDPPNWDLRRVSPAWIRARATRSRNDVDRALETMADDDPDTKSAHWRRDAATYFLDMLGKPNPDEKKPIDVAYIRVCFACIRWWLAPTYGERFRPDWPTHYAWIDCFSPTSNPPQIEPRQTPLFIG